MSRLIPMLYQVLADVTVLIHLLWVLFLVGGAYWGRRDRAVMAIHVLGLVYSLVLQVAGWYCPLTHLEVWLRQRHDPLLAYPGSFLAHYAERLVYLDVPPQLVLLLTLLLMAITGIVYGRALSRSSRRRA